MGIRTSLTAVSRIPAQQQGPTLRPPPPQCCSFSSPPAVCGDPAIRLVYLHHAAGGEDRSGAVVLVGQRRAELLERLLVLAGPHVQQAQRGKQLRRLGKMSAAATHIALATPTKPNGRDRIILPEGSAFS